MTNIVLKKFIFVHPIFKDLFNQISNAENLPVRFSLKWNKFTVKFAEEYAKYVQEVTQLRSLYDEVDIEPHMLKKLEEEMDFGMPKINYADELQMDSECVIMVDKIIEFNGFE